MIAVFKNLGKVNMRRKIYDKLHHNKNILEYGNIKVLLSHKF